MLFGELFCFMCIVYNEIKVYLFCVDENDELKLDGEEIILIFRVICIVVLKFI